MTLFPQQLKAACICMLLLLLFTTCTKEQKDSTVNETEHNQTLKLEFDHQKVEQHFITRFNDSLNLLFVPDWDKVSVLEKSDTQTVYFLPLYARLKRNSSSVYYNVLQNAGRKALIVYQRDGKYIFNAITYPDQGSAAERSNARAPNVITGDTIKNVLVENLNGLSYQVAFQKVNGKFQKIASLLNKTPRASRASSIAAPQDRICYNVCTWGFYCPSDGYHVTVTVAEGYCLGPTPETCPDSWPIGSNTGGYTPAWQMTYSEIRCLTAPPTNVIDPDPTHLPSVGGTYTSGIVKSRDFPALPNTTDQYNYTCPSNFTFVSVTTNDLWQEAAISNAYANLIYIDQQEDIYIPNRVVLPIIYFGVPYFDHNGKQLYTRMDAANMATDALNYGEFRMRKAFSANPRLTSLQLQDIWVEKTDYYIRLISKGLARSGTKGSLNTSTPVVPRVYTACN
ncbi:hypothetical protein [Chitinophaga sp. Ak27]|uniref:hypothetical protein n=1 Tax=Chitinophaga sp. Ak27 TaxID=2726116 RepID=UPI00145DF795|nr:hypothetical protein [Chitinophaga sp. Ak27]NLU94909.1 hypothetical protein [Chitinophaga sp. Ak27]